MRARRTWLELLLLGSAALHGCGGRTAILVGDLVDAGGAPHAERCNQLDDDHDGKVDEIFRDAKGRYVDDQNCGSCGHACSDPVANASSQGCGLLGEMPACVAIACADGFGLSRSGGCAPLDDRLCLACQNDDDCGPLAGAVCIGIGGENRCTRLCENGCPDGYSCANSQCVPQGGSCNCSGTSERFEVACRPPDAKGDCTGRARCENGELSQCASPAERCNGEDDDCDGMADEGFVDDRGAYSLDQANCGACGVDCGIDTPVTGRGPIQLMCGGDPFAPTCVTRCPDAQNGIQLGDHLDADRELENGCECVVQALSDASGGADGDVQLDANCDGADGDVTQSFYVSVDGDDSGPGSPTRPLRTINVAVARASASLDTDHPRPHVYVAAGVYTESVQLRDGVRLHGGYRSDFLAQSASGFEVIVVAPTDTDAPFGAALVIDRAGRLPTLVEGMRFRGRDAVDSGAPAVGAVIDDARSGLVLRALEIASGHPGTGAAGGEGEAGDTPVTRAGDGAAPRAALEGVDHVCFSSDNNRTRGGSGATSTCGGNVNVSGGGGGSAVCPVVGTSGGAFAGGGSSGLSASGGFGGPGGGGGQDVVGPILRGASCAQDVCCGLADFSVDGALAYPEAGQPGGDGRAGGAGSACTDPLGSFSASSWNAGGSAPGGSGGPGGGGGGGGAGGGAQLNWTSIACEFADGLGGGGGGGGGGGCGGLGGGAGQAGGIALALLVRNTSAEALPAIQDVRLLVQDAGNGGDGGAGGDGGLGGSGGLGGNIDNALRSTPTMAGVMSGQRGGKGGNGGGGGGGGGGCGGSTVGLWVTGVAQDAALAMRLRNGNKFELGAPGDGGRGGGGPLPAQAGTAGMTVDVLLR